MDQAEGAPGSSISTGGAITTRPPARSTVGTTAFVKGKSRVSPPCAGRTSRISPAPKLRNRQHLTKQYAVDRLRAEPFEIGQIKLVLVGRRQIRARRENFDTIELLCAAAVSDALDARHEHVLALRADIGQQEFARATLVEQRPVGRDREGIGGETLQADFAAHAMRRAETPQQNKLPPLV